MAITTVEDAFRDVLKDSSNTILAAIPDGNFIIADDRIPENGKQIVKVELIKTEFDFEVTGQKTLKHIFEITAIYPHFKKDVARAGIKDTVNAINTVLQTQLDLQSTYYNTAPAISNIDYVTIEDTEKNSWIELATLDFIALERV